MNFLLWDKNQTLQIPKGVELTKVAAVGSFIILTYAMEVKNGRVDIEIYLNDQGREVIRTAKGIDYKNKGAENADRSPKSKDQTHL